MSIVRKRDDLPQSVQKSITALSTNAIKPYDTRYPKINKWMPKRIGTNTSYFRGKTDKSAFVKLPREIRVMIYNHCILSFCKCGSCGENGVPTIQPKRAYFDYSGMSIRGICCLPLIFVNKQIYEELGYLIYRQLDCLVISAPRSLHRASRYLESTMPLPVEITNMSQWPLLQENIRHIAIEIPYEIVCRILEKGVGTCHAGFFPFKISRLFEYLKGCKSLESVTIKLGPLYTSHYHEQMSSKIPDFRWLLPVWKSDIPTICVVGIEDFEFTSPLLTFGGMRLKNKWRAGLVSALTHFSADNEKDRILHFHTSTSI